MIDWLSLQPFTNSKAAVSSGDSTLYMQHYMMLSRNLLHTGLTCAKQLAILVGPAKAIGLAVKQARDTGRYTLLAQRLASD